MKHKFTAAALLVTVFCAFCGCSAQERSSVNIIDAGSASISTNNQSAKPISPDKTGSSSLSGEHSSSSSEISTVSSSVSGDIPNDFPTASENEQTSRTEPGLPVQSSSESPAQPAESAAQSSSAEPVVIPNEPIVSNSYQALNYGEVKGIWISYIELAEMPSGSEAEFRASIAEAYDNCLSLGINTVYVHVRSHGDAYYESELFPRTKYLSGSYDPLEVMIEEAHARNLSFQAWINPLRACAVSDISRESGYPIYSWAGGETRLVQVGSYYYLNPAYDEVIDLIAEGAGEIAANYDIDGLHIDDYFYPTTDPEFDRESFQSSSYDTLSEFRFANCDKLVSSLYGAVKSANASALFGISCQGNLDNNYNQMYADVEKWCCGYGYTDYIMPQIYYGFENSTQPFADCVKMWDNIAVKGRIPLIAGLSAAKVGCEDAWAGDGKNEWINDRSILKRQFLETAEQEAYGGICLFSYRSVFNPDYDVAERVADEISDLKSVLN